MVDAIILELKLQKNFFQSTEVINTIYFGGGTPSILPSDSISKIIDIIYKNFNIINENTFKLLLYLK